MENRKIVTAGYVSLDITPSIRSASGVTLHDMIRPGKLIQVGKATAAPGGCMSNTGLALHKLGSNVSLVAKIGDDAFGRILTEEYNRKGVRPDFLVSKDTETSYTLVLAVPGSDRCFLADAGANDTLTADELSYEEIGEAQYFHFGYPTLMRRFYLNEGSQTVEMLKKVKALGLVTSLDMAAIDPSSEAGAQDWKTILANVLPYVDFFVPSIEELCFILDRDKYNSWQKQYQDDICMHLSLSRDVIPLAQKALDLGCRAVLLKCGAAGLYLKTGTEEVMKQISPHFQGEGWGGLSIFEDSYVPDQILSGTGAGDTAIAAFLYSLSHDFSPEVCLEMAAGCGAMCITQYDALSGLIPADRLLERIRSGWAKQKMIHE